MSRQEEQIAAVSAALDKAGSTRGGNVPNVPAGNQQGVAPADPPPAEPVAATNQQTPVEPRPAAEPTVDAGDGEQRVPLSRLNTVINRAKETEDRNATLQNELAEAQRKLALVDLQHGERPAGWSDMTPEQQMFWMAEKVSSHQPAPGQEPTTTNTDTDEKFALMAKGFTAPQAEMLHGIQKQFPGIPADEAMTIANLRTPGTFSSEGSQQQASAAVPASHVTGSPRPASAPTAQQKDDGRKQELITQMDESRFTGSRSSQKRAGMEYIRHQLGMNG